jgi:UDP-N-acetylmuramate--alanine ligase
MLNSVDFSGKPFHFIGIGGIGMSALAYVLTKRKLPVSGSDLRLTHITERLQALGAHIFWSQDATNLEFFGTSHGVANATLPVGGEFSTSTELIKSSSISKSNDSPAEQALVNLPQVICSTAINATNAEYRAAVELGCAIFHRSDLLAALIQEYQSIAVAGTHGKTTTSSLIGYMLLQAGLDPTIIVGGEVDAWEGNARLGQGSYLVAEADESDGSLVKFRPTIGIITNAELDHTDHYHSLAEVVNTFQTFVAQCQVVVGCIDCDVVRQQLFPTISYSLQADSGADYTVDQISYRAEGTTARVWERGELLGELHLALLGQHNLSNALAAVAVGRYLGIGFARIATAIAPFIGAHRRFEQRGEANRIAFIDDYAHHPSEIQATLSSARLQASRTNPQRRVVAIFQPHRYSRTLTFLAEFAQSFSHADVVVVSDIYSAGEANPGTITGQQLALAIANYHPEVHYQASLPEVSQFLNKLLIPGDLAIFLGAGNLNQIIPAVLAAQQSLERATSSEVA